jgi:hypothetical protein
MTKARMRVRTVEVGRPHGNSERERRFAETLNVAGDKSVSGEVHDAIVGEHVRTPTITFRR